MARPSQLVPSVLFLIALCVGSAAASDDGALALVGATVHVGAATEPLDDAVVVVRDGRIVDVGASDDVRIPVDARLVDVSGLTIVPGFVDAAAELDLDFPDVVEHQGRPADDAREVFPGMLDANRRGVVPEREAWRVLGQDVAERDGHRGAGFTSFVVAPSGQLLAGVGAHVLCNDRPPREAVRDTDVAQFGAITWRSRSGSYSGNAYPATLMGVMAHLRQVLLDAGHRRELARRHEEGLSRTPPVMDPVLIALEPVLSGKTRLVLHADVEEDIRLVLGLADDFPGLDVAILGGLEAHELADELARRDVAVVHDLDFGDEPEQPGAEDGTRKVRSARAARRRARVGMTDEPDDDEGEGDEPDDEETDDADEDDDESSDDEPGAVLPPFDPGLPTRVRADRHARWLANVTGVETLFEAGVDVRFATRGRKPGELLGDLRTAIEKGGLTHEHALAGLTGGATLRQGAPASLVAWRGELLSKGSEARVAVVEGALFDERDVAERRAVARAADEESSEEEPGDDDGVSDEEDSDEVADAADEEAAEDDESITVPLVEWPSELDEDRTPDLRTGGDVLVRGATILTVSHGTLEDHDMLVRDGKIAELGEDLVAPEGVTVVDAEGMFLVPGIIDCHSHCGIRGGINEWTRSVTAEVTIEDEVNPDDVNLYRALAGGVTTIRQLHGSANVIGGRHAIVKLRWGKSAPEMLFEGAPDGVKFALGENPKRSNWGSANRFPGSRMGVEATLRRTFEAALRYVDGWERYGRAVAAGEAVDPPRRDLRLEAIAGILDGEIGVHSHCYRADEILMLMGVAEEFGFEVATLQHVLEGYKIGREIAAHGGFGGSTFVDWWAFKAEASMTTPYNTALMHEAGVLMSVNSDSDEHLRRLYLEAAKTVKYGGMAEQDALATVTLNPAIQLGISERVGSIDVGKDADFALFSHHPFDTRTVCLHTFVDGECYFTRDDSTYDAWRDEVAARVRHGADPLPPRGDRTTRLSDEEVDAALALLDLPRHGTAAPSTPERPAPPEDFAFVGGVVHTLDADGAVHEPGVVHVSDGRIVDVSAGDAVREGFTAIDVSGRHVWPGMIDASSSLGLIGTSSVAGTVDRSDRGGNQADLRASTAFHPASVHIPVARVNGITSTLVTPAGGSVSGQSSLMALEGWTVAEALLEDAVALHVSAIRTPREDRAWNETTDASCHLCTQFGAGLPAPLDAEDSPEPRPLSAEGRKLAEKIDERWSSLRDAFEDARLYARRVLAADRDGTPPPDYDPRLAAMAPYAFGRAPVVFAANRADRIADAIRFARTEGLDAVIHGGREAWKVADLLAASDVPVLLGPVLSLPMNRWDPYDAAYSNASLLHDAGVRFAFTSSDSSAARNLPYQAAMAVAYGLPEDAAMLALTRGAAEILGMADRIGSIEDGKRADLLVTDGSPLQVRTTIEHLVVGGRRVPLETLHTRLYDEYRERLQDPATPSR